MSKGPEVNEQNIFQKVLIDDTKLKHDDVTEHNDDTKIGARF